MASGFIQRWKGKANFDPSSLWVAGSPLYGPGSAQSLSTTSASALISNGGVTAISATSVIAIYRLQAPAYASQEKTIQLTTVSSGVFITLYPSTLVAAAVFLNGSSINCVIKSTQAGVVSLCATSTANWAIVGVYPGSTLVNSILTLSTST